jgi:hypothetical protein
MKKKSDVKALLKLVDQVSFLGNQDIYYDESFDSQCYPEELDKRGRSPITRKVQAFQDKLNLLTREVIPVLEFIHNHPEIESLVTNISVDGSLQ